MKLSRASASWCAVGDLQAESLAELPGEGQCDPCSTAHELVEGSDVTRDDECCTEQPAGPSVASECVACPRGSSESSETRAQASPVPCPPSPRFRGLRHSQPLPRLQKDKNVLSPFQQAFLKDRWRDQKRIEDLDETVRMLEGELERTRQDSRVTVLEAANAALIRDNLALLSTNASLKKTVDDASQLETRFFELQCFASDLIKANTAMQTRNAQLEQAIINVSRCNDDLVRRNLDLVTLNGALGQRVATFESEYSKRWASLQAL